MLRPSVEVKRSLDRSDQFTIAELQAKTARIVGTHLGSPLRLLYLERVGVDLLQPNAIAKGLAKLAIEQPDRITKVSNELARHTPASARKKLTDLRPSHIHFVGRGPLCAVGLGFDNPTLDSEAVALNFGFDEITGVSPPIERFQHLDFALVGREHTATIKKELSQWLRETRPTISLEPIGRRRQQDRFSAAS